MKKQLFFILILILIIYTQLNANDICNKYLLGQSSTFDPNRGSSNSSGPGKDFWNFYDPKNIQFNVYSNNPNPDKIYLKNNLKSYNLNSLTPNFINMNIIKQINAIPQSLQRSTNLTPQPSIPNQSISNVRTSTPDTSYSYFVYDVETGVVEAFNSRARQARRITMVELLSMYQLETAYFPFVFDSLNPTQLIFGVGAGAMSTSTLSYQTLIRNGGHLQLAKAYRGHPLPNLNGLYGGGFRIQDGHIKVEFQSRGVNSPYQGTVDGLLDEELANTLSPLVQSIILKSLSDSLTSQRELSVPREEVLNPEYVQPLFQIR